jgi:hypothetical protein
MAAETITEAAPAGNENYRLSAGIRAYPHFRDFVKITNSGQFSSGITESSRK